MIDSTWYSRPGGVIDAVSAGGIVTRREDGRLLVALVTEAGHPDYVIPKGHVEAGETVEAAARREIGEEAGFHRLKLVRKLAVLKRLNFERTKWKTIHYFLFETDEIESKPLDPERHPCVGWFPVDELPPMFWPEQQSLVLGLRPGVEGHA